MHDEQLEILDFLRRHAPFDGLAEERLQQVARSVDVRYVKAGTQIVEFGQPAVAWHVVRSGAVEVFRRDGSLHNRLTEGGYFGEAGLLQRRRVRFPVRALDDTLLYLIPEPVFTDLFEHDEHFADIVESEDRSRLRQVVSRREESNPLLSATVDSLLGRQPVTIAPSASAAEAAALMTEHQVSALLIVDADDAPAEGPRLVGIVTDRDFRSRLVARARGVEVPVRDIMTAELVTIDQHQLVFEAMMQMLRSNIHHLPVLRQGQPVGVIALSDVIRYESHNSLFVVGSIARQTTVDELAALTPAVHASFTRMVGEGASARMVGTSMAVIGRSFKQRLLELAEAQLGPPPLPYCFLALGSMARHEQLIVTDQDNALILDDRFDPAQHDAYFKQLADFVSDGLARCGYPYCSGGVMASNERWRLPLRAWEQHFTHWIEQPTAQSLLHSSIFFDIDGVWGRTEWPERLCALIARKARSQPRFLASMARNALLRTPPIGFFKEFVVEADGRHSEAINLKRRGTAPMTDLIRVHALAVGSRALNSFERLQDVIAAGILPPGRGQDLHDALEFISSVRIRNQADDLAAGREPDNSVEPAKLSTFDRKSLRDAFSILADAQGFLKFRYQSARAG
ncbi:MAG: cyclic nucleotide-binding/CBS domain-containing protein [Burkholderiaceae bacterium]|nr:cyclic nucleotide-binding/CBS domain-containing protein [Burkholderiaceae bacterium]